MPVFPWEMAVLSLCMTIDWTGAGGGMDGLIIMSGRKKTQQCLYQLAGQKAPEISVNSRNGNQEENKEETNDTAHYYGGVKERGRR